MGANKKVAKAFAKADNHAARKRAAEAAQKMADMENAERLAVAAAAGGELPAADTTSEDKVVPTPSPPRSIEPLIATRRLGGGVAPLKGKRLTTFADVSALVSRHGRKLPRQVLAGCSAVLDMGFAGSRIRPTLVQAECWGWLLAPTPPDLIAISPTGSGKTLAFLLPLIADLATRPPPRDGAGGEANAAARVEELLPAPAPPLAEVAVEAKEEEVKAAADAAMREAATAAFKRAMAAGATQEEARTTARVEGQAAWKVAKKAAKKHGAATAAAGLASCDLAGVESLATGTGTGAGTETAGSAGIAGAASPAGLVLAPTRELCLQIADVARKLGDPAAVRTTCVVGGVDFTQQRRELLSARPQVLVATPGRLLSLCGKVPASSRARQQQPAGSGGGASEEEERGGGASEPSCQLGGVDILVLDEADRLLELGFEEDLSAIMDLVRKPKSGGIAHAVDGRSEATAAAAAAAAAATAIAPGRSDTMPWMLMFSATWTASTARLARTVLAAGAVHVTVGGEATAAVSTVEQRVEVLRGGRGAPRVRRLTALLQAILGNGTGSVGGGGEDYEEDEGEGEDEREEEVAVEQGEEVAEAEERRAAHATAASTELEAEGAPLVIVFCVYKKEVKDISRLMSARGFSCAPLHGDMSQTGRAEAVASFRAGIKRVLVATDVAARGLDVPSVSHVVNLSVGLSIDAYVHRVGRCGRAGRSGIAHTLVVDGDEPLAGPLAQLLDRSRQLVPRELVEMARSHRLAQMEMERREAPREGGGGEDEEDEEDEKRAAQIANREQQLAQQKLRLQKERVQQTKRAARSTAQMLR